MNPMSTLLHVVDTMNPDLTQTDLANDSDTDISVPKIDAQTTGVSLTAVTLASGVWSRFKLGCVPGLELEAVRSPQHPKCELDKTRPPSSGPESSAFSNTFLFIPPSIVSFLPAAVQVTLQQFTMATKTGLSPWIDGLAVPQSVAKAVPVLGAPVEGSIEAVKQILQYTEVSRLHV
jgi:hypothetical protein